MSNPVLPSGELLELFVSKFPYRNQWGHMGQKVKFVLLGKESFPPILTQNFMVGDFGSGLTQGSTSYCGKPEVVLGKLVMGNGSPSGGIPSLKI